MIEKIENLEQYAEVEKKITELLKVTDDETPLTDPKMIELLEWSKLIEDYDNIHFQVGKSKNKG